MNRRRFLQLIAALPFVKLPIGTSIAKIGDVIMPQHCHVMGLDEPEDTGGITIVWDETNVVFVDAENGNDVNDGLSLETAKRTLAAALLVDTHGPRDVYQHYPSGMIGRYGEETNHADA